MNKQKIYVSIVLGIFVAMAFSVGLWMIDAVDTIQYFAEFDYVEGVIFNQIEMARQGKEIYSPISEAPYMIVNYPPVYRYAVLLLDNFTDDLLMAGRLVSFISTILSALLISGIIHHMLAGKYDKQTRILSEIAGSLIYLNIFYPQHWGMTMRVDMLAVAFALAGLYCFLRIQNENKKLVLAAMFFILAAFTKQSIIAYVGGCFVACLFTNRRLAFKLFMFMLIPSAIILCAEIVATNGEFWFHHVTANKNSYSIQEALSNVAVYVVMLYYIIFVMSVGFVYAQIKDYVQKRRDDCKNSMGKNISPNFLLSCCWILSFVMIFSIGKIGANTNYYLEFFALVSIIVSIQIAKMINEISLWRVVLIAIIFCSILLGYYYNPQPPEKDKVYTESMLHDISSASGEIISEDMVLLTRAGRYIYFQPYIMKQLLIQGIWDQSPVVQAIKSKKVARIILKNDINSLPERDSPQILNRFTPEVVEAIRENYKLKTQSEKIFIYEPK